MSLYGSEIANPEAYSGFSSVTLSNEENGDLHDVCVVQVPWLYAEWNEKVIEEKKFWRAGELVRVLDKLIAGEDPWQIGL